VKRFLFGLFWASTSLYGSAVLVTDPTSVSTSEFVNWMQLGADVSPTFFAYSTDYQYSLTGHLSSGTGQVVTAASAKGADGAVAATDDLLVTGSTTSTTPASVTLTLLSPVYGAGAYLEGINGTGADAGATFTIRIQAFDGVSSVLSSTALVTSDGSGDPIFVGVTDLTQEVTKVIYTLTDASGNAIAGNFALDQLYVQNSLKAVVPPPNPKILTGDPPGVPEPAVTILVGSGLLALIFGLRKRSACA